MHSSVSPDHDDHDGGDVRRVAAGHRHGCRKRMRQPLGIAIVGGLIVSQMLTLVHHAGHLSRARSLADARKETNLRDRPLGTRLSLGQLLVKVAKRPEAAIRCGMKIPAVAFCAILSTMFAPRPGNPANSRQRNCLRSSRFTRTSNASGIIDSGTTHFRDRGQGIEGRRLRGDRALRQI